ncbi:MAG: choice-of-anchor B domain-containing protein [Bacteroidia bacterium]|jgi:choice-of-anchor B domain-containing protein
MESGHMDMLTRSRTNQLSKGIILAVFLLLVFTGVATQAHDDSLPGTAKAPPHTRENMRKFAEDHHHNENLAAQSITTCVAGMAGGFPCNNVDLMAFLPTSQIGGGNGNDIWGWTDPLNGNEYALMGLTNGTAFVDISDPVNPVYLGHLPPHSGVSGSSWRDIKTYNNHAFIGSEAAGSGMQIVDLTQLRNIASPPATITETAFYLGFTSSHNIVINEDSGFAYGVGTNSGNCNRGLHFVDLLDPTSPVAAGCFSADGYTHDAQCVNYTGPDADYQGKEVCFAYNTDTLTIVDVTNKLAPVQISRTSYTNRGYTHQGWLTADQNYLLLGDELDEQNVAAVSNTRTLIWNVSDLDNPVHEADYTNPLSISIDHNQYIVGDHSFQANYRSGLRILDISDIANGNLSEVGYFDIYPSGDSANFNGAWSVYPFFASGNVIVSGIEQGLFILRPNLGTPDVPPVVNLLDPAQSSDVSAMVQIRIDATDTEDAEGTLDVEWNVDGGPWQPTIYFSPDYLASWDSTSVLDGAHTINARAIDSNLQADTDAHSISTSNGQPKFTVDVIDVNVQIGNGNRNRGIGTLLVSDEGGSPLGGVQVGSIFTGDWGGSFSSTSDGNGMITVQTQKVKNLAYVKLCVDTASLSGWEFDSAASLLCADSDGGGSTFGVVGGKVTEFGTADGIPNASVSTDTGQSINTDAFGDYLISNVPAGTRTISVAASTYTSQNTTTTVTDGATSTVDFALVKAPTGGSGAIKGTVNSGNSKLNGVTVNVIGGSSSQTNKGGKYSIQNVPAGSQMVEASKSGYLSQTLEVIVVAGGSVTLNFNLAPNP